MHISLMACLSGIIHRELGYSSQTTPPVEDPNPGGTSLADARGSAARFSSWNHSLKRICYQISRDQVDHDISSKLLSQVGHQKVRRNLLTPKRSPDLPVLTLERSDNKCFSSNDSTVPRMC